MKMRVSLSMPPAATGRNGQTVYSAPVQPLAASGAAGRGSRAGQQGWVACSCQSDQCTAVALVDSNFVPTAQPMLFLAALETGVKFGSLVHV